MDSFQKDFHLRTSANTRSKDLRQGTQCFVLRMDPKVGFTGSRGKVPSMGPKVGSLGWGTKLGFKA